MDYSLLTYEGAHFAHIREKKERERLSNIMDQHRSLSMRNSIGRDFGAYPPLSGLRMW